MTDALSIQPKQLALGQEGVFLKALQPFHG